MNSRCFFAPSSRRPVVRSSSPPDNHGVGFSSSVMWTQRTGASPPPSPAASSRPISLTSSRTVSIRRSVPHDAVPRLRQYGAQHRIDLLELLGVGDQRRRELDHGIPAVVGATDQPALVELAGEEAAQLLLRLLVAEALLGFLVLDQLERVEVAGAAHVADDRQILADALQHLAELALL